MTRDFWDDLLRDAVFSKAFCDMPTSLRRPIEVCVRHSDPTRIMNIRCKQYHAVTSIK